MVATTAYFCAEGLCNETLFSFTNYGQHLKYLIFVTTPSNMHFRAVGWLQAGVIGCNGALALTQFTRQLIAIFH